MATFQLGKSIFVATAVLGLGAVGCGILNRDTESSSHEPTAPTNEEKPPQDANKPGTENSSGHASLVSDFLRSEVASQQSARKDDGQLILTNTKGEVVIAGVTRSKIFHDSLIEPSFAGDLFLTRYTAGKGWSNQPIQVPVVAPPPPPPAAPVAGTTALPVPTPSPLPNPLVAVKGGRLLDSGKTVLVGELQSTLFSTAQLNLEETAGASRSIFLAVFGAGENGLMKTVRFGIKGSNSVVASAAGSKPNTILLAGHTDGGLRKNSAQSFATETAAPSNYIAEIDEGGTIVRHIAWAETNPGGSLDHVAALASAPGLAIAAIDRAAPSSVVVKGLRMIDRADDFVDLVEKPVCEKASQGATAVHATAMDVSRDELVVTVEIQSPSATSGYAFPCVEVFQILPNGSLVSKREIIDLNELPTLAGTSRAMFVNDQQILVARTRDITDGNGSGAAVVTFLYKRPIIAGAYEGHLWARSRPADWYEVKDVNGLSRTVRSMSWSSGPSKDVVWILSNDVTNRKGEQESLVHIGTYQSTPQDRK